MNSDNNKPSSSEAAGTSSSSSTGEKSTKTPGRTKHSSKSREPSQDITVKSSATTNSSHKKTSADSLKSSNQGMHNSEKSNSGAKLPCTTVGSNNSSFKNTSTSSSTDSKSSKPFKNRRTSTELAIKKSPVQSNCKQISSNKTYLKCNGQISLAVNNKRDERECTKGSHPAKSNNTSDCSGKLVSIIANCNTEKIVSKCKDQSAIVISDPKNSSLGSNLLEKGNLQSPDVENTIRSIVKTNTNKNKDFTKSSLVPVVAEKLSSKSPKKRRDSKKRVSFHLANLKKDSTKCDRPEEKMKTQSHPPKVRFSVKFQDNTLRSRLKQSNYKLVDSKTSSASKFLKKSCSGLLQNCHESAVEYKEMSETSEDHNHKTKICNSVLNSSISPTKTISHSPKPPSTVKLKQV